MPRTMLLALALALLLGPLSPMLATAQTATPVAADGDFAGPVDIGSGRTLYLECHGSGSPTVVLEAGYRSPAIFWTDDLISPGSGRLMVLPGVAAGTRVCAYERPGVSVLLDGGFRPSRSSDVAMPRADQDIVTDLHTLLRTAGVPGPYVLVGHSLGGLFVRLYTSTYPDEVVGLVLVDALFEGLENLMTPEQWADFVTLNAQVPSDFADDPFYETLDFNDATATMRDAVAASPLRPMPLVVLSRGVPIGVSAADLGFDPDVFEQTWAASEDELAALVPNARHVVATDSSHYIQLENPELVIQAVAEVVAAVRDPDSWTASPASPIATYRSRRYA